MRDAATLIAAARLVSRNVANGDGSYSIPDNEVLQYLNDAQDTAQNKLSTTKNAAKIFMAESIISLVANQSDYTIPDRVLINKQVQNVEFSATGALSDYCRLEKVNYFNRDTNATTYPSGYYRRGNQIVLQPTPSNTQGSIRVMYERTLDDLNVVADTVNGTPSGSSIIVTTGNALFVVNAYINIVDILGNVYLRNGLISGYNGGTKTITLSAAVSTYLLGSYTLANLASQSIVIGQYNTNISQLPDACETYLIHSAAADIFGKDSSDDYTRQKGKADDILTEIINLYRTQTAEVEFVPQMNRYEWW